VGSSSRDNFGEPDSDDEGCQLAPDSDDEGCQLARDGDDEGCQLARGGDDEREACARAGDRRRLAYMVWTRCWVNCYCWYRAFVSRLL